MLQARQFQPEAPAIIFVVFEHLLDLEAFAVAGTGPFTVGLGGQQIPRLLAPRSQYIARWRPATACFWVKATFGQNRHSPGHRAGNIWNPSAPSRRTYSWARSRRQRPQPCFKDHWARTPVPNSRSPNNITSAPSGIQPATVPKAYRCWAKLEAPGPSIFH